MISKGYWIFFSLLFCDNFVVLDDKIFVASIDTTEEIVDKPENAKERKITFSGKQGDTTFKYQTVSCNKLRLTCHLFGPFEGPKGDAPIYRASAVRALLMWFASLICVVYVYL